MTPNGADSHTKGCRKTHQAGWVNPPSVALVLIGLERLRPAQVPPAGQAGLTSSPRKSCVNTFQRFSEALGTLLPGTWEAPVSMNSCSRFCDPGPLRGPGTLYICTTGGAKIAVGTAGQQHVHHVEGCPHNSVSAGGGHIAAHLLIAEQDGVRLTADAKAMLGDGSSADVYLH